MMDMFLRQRPDKPTPPPPQPIPKPPPPSVRIARLATLQAQRPLGMDMRPTPMPESPIIRPTLGRFRRSLNAATTGKVGIGILAYFDKAEAQRAVEAVLRYAKPNYTVLLFDNGEDAETAEWAMKQTGFRYLRSPYNTGCGNARNRMADYFASVGCEYFIAQDQDVVWAGDAAAPMLDVFGRYKGTGCVTWKLAVQTMGAQRADRWDATGKLNPPETPGMMCCYSMKALADDTIRRGNGVGRRDADLIGWYPGYGLCYRFDTDVCFALWSKGYDTRVVTQGQCMVRHVHPHHGVSKLGKTLPPERAFSDRVLRARSARYGWPWFT